MRDLRQGKMAILMLTIILILSLTGCTTDITATTLAPVEIPLEQSRDSEQPQPRDLPSSPSVGDGQQQNIESLPDHDLQNAERLRVHYIDVGQADSILIQIPNGKNVLIDAGNNEDAEKIVSYLQNQGVSKLDVIIGTHPHEDHIGAMDTIIETFEIGQIIMPKVSANTNSFSEVLVAVKAKDLKITEAKAGLILDLGPEVTAQLIAPNSSSYEDLNSYSAVLKLTYGESSFLFTGDADEVSEREMIAAGYDLSANVLKVGHHGSKSSSTSGFLALVSPEYAVLSVGKDNKYGHPAKATLARLSTVGAEIYQTDQLGTIVVESDGKEVSITTEF